MWYSGRKGNDGVGKRITFSWYGILYPALSMKLLLLLQPPQKLLCTPFTCWQHVIAIGGKVKAKTGSPNSKPKPMPKPLYIHLHKEHIVVILPLCCLPLLPATAACCPPLLMLLLLLLLLVLLSWFSAGFSANEFVYFVKCQLLLCYSSSRSSCSYARLGGK